MVIDLLTYSLEDLFQLW